MAHAPRLDFQAFVTESKGQLAGSTADSTGHEYAYAFDRQSRMAFDRTKPVAFAVEASVRLFKQIGMHQLLGHAVRVSDRQFPSIHRLACRAADSLPIAVPEVFVVNNPTFNAGTLGTNDDSFIIVHSALVDQCSEDELLAVLGHECGHIHNSHVAYLTALHYLTYMAGLVLPWVLQPALVALRAWSRRAEVTSDRAAMLVVRDRAVVERAITKAAVGSAKLYEGFNVDAFVDQYEAGHRGIGKYMEMFASHPWLPKRVLAMRVFSESRLYRERIGEQASGLSMSEVDSRVAAILKGDA
ncbi:MAG: M48 family metallopeptidase [Polyangiaceae bacterium]|jgi:Zn-dependent protease with chaperone function